MKRFIFYIAVLLLSFGFGISAAKLYYTWYIQFECRAVYAIITPPDGSGRGATFKSLDGEKLESNLVSFPSRQLAEVALQTKLRAATEILERKPLHNEEGETIGERVVAVFPPNEMTRTGYVLIIRVENNRLFEIASTSLRHAVAFENGAPRD